MPAKRISLYGVETICINGDCFAFYYKNEEGLSLKQLFSSPYECIEVRNKKEAKEKVEEYKEKLLQPGIRAVKL